MLFFVVLWQLILEVLQWWRGYFLLYYGSWFSRCYSGGEDTFCCIMAADSRGVTVVEGFLFVVLWQLILEVLQWWRGYFLLYYGSWFSRCYSGGGDTFCCIMAADSRGVTVVEGIHFVVLWQLILEVLQWWRGSFLLYYGSWFSRCYSGGGDTFCCIMAADSRGVTVVEGILFVVLWQLILEVLQWWRGYFLLYYGSWFSRCYSGGGVPFCCIMAADSRGVTVVERILFVVLWQLILEVLQWWRGSFLLYYGSWFSRCYSGGGDTFCCIMAADSRGVTFLLYYGSWFSRCYSGGGDTFCCIMAADSRGVTVVEGFLFVVLWQLILEVLQWWRGYFLLYYGSWFSRCYSGGGVPFCCIMAADSRGVTVVEGILFVVLWQLILEVLQWWRGSFLLYYGSWFSRCYSGGGDTFCCIMAADSRGVTVVEGILFVVLWQLILEVLQWWRGSFLLYYGSWFSRCYSGGEDTFCCIMAADSRGVRVVEGFLFVVLWQLILEVLQWWRGYFLLYYGSWFSRCYSGGEDTFCCIMAADSRGVAVVEGFLFVVLWQLILEVLNWWRGSFLLYYGSWFSRCYSGGGDTFCCIMAADSRGVTVVEGILFVVLWQLILEVLQWWRGFFLLYYSTWFSRCYSGGGDPFCCIMADDSRGVTVVEGILFVVLWQLILEVLQWWRG